jgi:hypothetical protein
MKIESLHEVKAKLSKIYQRIAIGKICRDYKKRPSLYGAFSRDGKNGSRKPVARAAKRLLAIVDRAHKGREKGFTRLEDVPD